MGRVKNYQKYLPSGTRIGDLEVIQVLGYDKNKHLHYDVVCHHCGRRFTIEKHSLLRQKSGCPICNKRHNLAGTVKNGYHVLFELNETDSSNNCYWVCACVKCGKLYKVSTSKLNFPCECSCTKEIGREKEMSDNIGKNVNGWILESIIDVENQLYLARCSKCGKIAICRYGKKVYLKKCKCKETELTDKMRLMKEITETLISLQKQKEELIEENNKILKFCSVVLS